MDPDAGAMDVAVHSDDDLPRGWRARFFDALLDAYPTRDALTQLLLLGLDYEIERIVSPTAGTEEAVTRIIQWARSERLQELVTAACRRAPHHEGLRLVAVEVGWAPAAAGSATEAIASVRTGLRALRALITPETRVALASFRSRLEGADRRLKRVADYKALHDRLHDVQFRLYAPIDSVERDFPGGESKVQLQLYALAFRSELAKFREIAGRETIASGDVEWIEDDLVEAQGLLGAAIDGLDAQKLAQALQRLRDVVQQQPTVINHGLLQAVADLDLADLISSLAAVSTQIAAQGGDAELAGWVTRAAGDLGTVREALDRHVQDHKNWQRADRELWRFEAELARAAGDVAPTWAGVERALQRVVANDAPWALELREVAALISQSVGNGGSVLTLLFARCRTLASDRFYQVDKDLKQLCDRIAPLGADVDALVNRMNEQ